MNAGQTPLSPAPGGGEAESARQRGRLQNAEAEESATKPRVAFWTLLETDLGWFGFRRVPVHAEKLIDRAGLPEDVRALIARVVKRTKLWRGERADVARELIAHFTDGLAAAAAPADLIRSFGDPKQAAKLIRRAKKRQRGYLWHAYKLAGKVIICFVSLFALVYLYFGLQVWTARPNIARNYLAELNAPALAVPEEERAWPLIREAIMASTEYSTIVDEGEKVRYVEEFFDDEPGSPCWLNVVDYLNENSRVLERLRKAASKPRFGYVIGRDEEADWIHKEYGAGYEADFNRSKADENPELVHLLLPYLSPMRQLGVLLTVDAMAAAADGNGDRALEDLFACQALGGFLEEVPFVISAFVGEAIQDRARITAGRILERSPGLLADRQWSILAHRVASSDPKRVLARGLRANAAFFQDMLQRYFSDDGTGDGVMLPSGISGLASMDLPYSGRPIRLSAQFAAPVGASIVAGRRAQSELFEGFLRDVEGDFAKPLWEQPRVKPGERLEEFLAQGLNEIRFWPSKIFAPAFGHINRTAERSLQRRDVLLTAIALELFHRREHRYPDSLDELVPDLLPAVPPDRHTGRPLNYVLKNGTPILYSVGLNLIDDHGTPPADGPNTQRDGRTVSTWLHPDDLARLRAEKPASIIDGDWILYPPSLAQ